LKVVLQAASEGVEVPVGGLELRHDAGQRIAGLSQGD